MIVFKMNGVDLSVGAHTEWVDHFQESGVIHFLLNTLKAEKNPDIFLLCLIIVLLQEAYDMFGL
jgi:hypothetical protein